ncbi:restriction endonuclease subunit S [Methyloceanibacter methanicus]|uniref:restriction endonuclease subunit S n=1 Tax=Methyloceanibacter methanicus TaxID=1774968 RepID=UPI00244E9A2D|nr:restriction endonuclease subunit S [Methyloceanibacter methanicus]
MGECVETVQTWNPAREGGGGSFRYIDISSVPHDRKTIAINGEIPTSEAPSRARQIVESGDVLVSTVRPNLNAVAYVPDELNGATASTGFCVLRPDQKRLAGRYLFHWVQSRKFVADMVKQATGQSYPAVSDKIVKLAQIPLPPLHEQNRIAAILDNADDLRRLRGRAVDRLGELGQAIFCEMFGDPRNNPKGLTKRALGSIIKVSSGEGLTSKNQRHGTYPVYGGNGINGYHDEFRVPEGTIVIGRVGVYCGAVHVTAAPAWVTDNALIVTKKDASIDTTYLADALRYANLNQYASRSAQPLVSGSRIYPVEILVPEAAEQNKFKSRICERNALVENERAHLEQLEALFSSLQSRAFRGEL